MYPIQGAGGGAQGNPGWDGSMLCGEGTVVNHGVRMIRAATLKCRAWTCEQCAPERGKQLRAQAHSGKPDMFITLTVNPEWGTGPADRAQALARAWRIVRKRACRKYGYKTIPFLAVFEATKRGEPHLHIIARCKWIGQAWLSDQMQELIGAPIVDVRRVSSRSKVASYVTKYVGKAPERFGKCKRYWASQNWEVESYDRGDRETGWLDLWDIRKVGLSFLRESWTLLGFELEEDGHWLIGRQGAPP